MSIDEKLDLPILTHSRIRTHKSCRRKDYIAYEHRIRPNVERSALRFGTAMHKAIEILGIQGIRDAVAFVDGTIGQWDSMYTLPTLRALLIGYHEHYTEHPLTIEVIASEVVFTLPIRNPETGSASRTFQQGGKIDTIARLSDGRVVIHEIKTTSENPSDERYWRRIMIDPQVTMYYLAAREIGHDVQTIVYDVIRKPAMKPEMATPPEKRKYKKDGGLYANQREADETPREWYDRLLADIRSRFDFYYGRREIPRIESDLEQFAYELWDVALDIRAAQLGNRWYRNAGRFTCDNCDYNEICLGLVPWDWQSVPDGFIRLNTQHPELEETHGYGSTAAAETTHTSATPDGDSRSTDEYIGQGIP